MCETERDRLGRLVRETWVAYCLETGNTKPSHIAPWEELSEWDKEADRRIADAIMLDAIKNIGRTFGRALRENVNP